MRILEQYVRGKQADQNLCEDFLVATRNFVAVLDGGTDISGSTFNGVAGGRFASHTVGRAITQLPADVDARTAVDALTTALNVALATATVHGSGRPPSTTLVMYSPARRELWRVGDASFRVDGDVHLGQMAIDDVTRNWRRAWTQALLLAGHDAESIAADDPGFAAMWPLVQLHSNFANTVGCEFSYGVLNGTHVPDEHLTVVDVSAAHELVLATDGYPDLLPTLEETEHHLSAVLAIDPLALGVNPAGRGLRPGWSSYDDRTYVRLAL